MFVYKLFKAQNVPANCPSRQHITEFTALYIIIKLATFFKLKIIHYVHVGSNGIGREEKRPPAARCIAWNISDNRAFSN